MIGIDDSNSATSPLNSDVHTNLHLTNILSSSIPPYAVLLTRHMTRKILNEEELLEAIKSMLPSGGEARLVSLEEHGLREVIRVISSAKVLVGMHGAALALSMFMAPRGILIELWPYGIHPDSATVYKAMCALQDSGITYMPWVNEDVRNTRTHPEYPMHLGGLMQMSSIQRDKVVTSIQRDKVTSVVCCQDPNWLFRVYQDTEVRLYAHEGNYAHETPLRSIPFTEVLRNGLEIIRKQKFMTASEIKIKIKHIPAKVKELQCFLRPHETNGGVKMKLKWQRPWSIDVLGCGDISYEVVVVVEEEEGSGGGGVIRDYILSEMYEMEFVNYLEFVDVWVTCVCDGVEGNDLYVKCRLG